MKKHLILFLLLTSYNIGFGYKPNKSDSLSYQNAYVIAQTKNQLAQAKYYNRVPNSDNQFTALLGTLITGFIALFSAFGIVVYNRKVEIKKNLLSQKEEQQKQQRIAAAELIKKTAEGFHAITWILWIAKITPKDFDENLVIDHDEKMNSIYSEIAGAQIILCSLSKSLYDETKEIVNRLYNYDGKVGKIASDLKNESLKSEVINKMGSLWQEVYTYSLELPKAFSEILENQIHKS